MSEKGRGERKERKACEKEGGGERRESDGRKRE